MKQSFSNPIIVFYIVMVFSLFVLFIPKAGIFFRLFNTFVHESGHALITLITSGKVCKINLNKNTSGQTITSSKYWICKILTSIAGYSSCALLAYGIFYLIQTQKFIYVFVLFIVLAVINLIFWVRNTFGVVWIIILIALNGVLIYYNIQWINRLITLFFTFILFFENIFSVLVLLKISAQNPKQSGDATNLANYTCLPAIIWALLLTGFVGYFAYLTITRFFPYPF